MEHLVGYLKSLVFFHMTMDNHPIPWIKKSLRLFSFYKRGGGEQ